MRGIVALILANLPTRWWPAFEDHYPVSRFAWLAGLATMFAGLGIGIPGYIGFMHEAAHGFNMAIGADPDLGIKSSGWGLASLPIYIFATPQGLLAMYLGFSGFLRATAAYLTDVPYGDFVLTGMDGAVRGAWSRSREWRAGRTRAAREGPEVPDRLVAGARLGRPDIELAIVASRRRHWPRGSYLVTSGGAAYRVGEAFDLETATGLRAVYPLTQLRTGEAIRHAIAYELPSGLPMGPDHSVS